jgi:hypothetical protein
VTAGPDVHSSLAEIDRKLRELQRELSMFSGQPTPETSEPSPAARTPMPPGSAPTPVTPPPQAPPPVPPSAPPRPGEGREAADPIVAEARETAARILDEAAARIGEMGQQIEELQRVYSKLRRSAGALVEDFRRLPEGGGTASAPRDYSGTVVVNAGPFPDIATLGAFEKSLSRLPGAAGVHVRGFEGDRALLDVRLPSPIPLIEELRRVVPFAFRVGEAGQGMVTLHLEGAAAMPPHPT